MGLFRSKPSPQQLFDIYSNGLPGAPQDPALGDELLASGEVLQLPGDASIRGLHKERPRQLLYSAVRQLDPPTGGKNQGALASESQDGPDCTSHGGRNAGDVSRAFEIVVLNEPDLWIARGATELIYGERGHGGGGMSVQRATKTLATGQLLRQDYRQEGGPDLRKYTFRTGDRHGRSGVPQAWKDIAADELRVEKWVRGKTAEECLDLMAAGYGGNGGSQFASRQDAGPQGLNRKSGSWNHAMAHVGYDLTREIWPVEVVFVANSWGAWNRPNQVWLKHQEVLGPWVHGMLVVPLEEFERHIVRAGSCYYHGRIEGNAIKKQPLTISDFVHWGVAA